MPALITIESIGDGDRIHLSETMIPDEANSIGTGEPIRIVVRNSGDTLLREITVGIDGPSADHIQLAIEAGGEPMSWTDPGRSITLGSLEMKPGDTAAFWSRTFYTPEDAEGSLEGQFVIQAISA
jgi:hypothetical protein